MKIRKMTITLNQKPRRMPTVKANWANWPILALLSLLVVLSACQPSHLATPQRRYPLQGDVVSVDARSNQVMVQHQDIPGFMAAMTMPYLVKDSAVFQTLKPGQRIAATLVVTDEHAWLEDIVITDASTAAPAVSSANAMHLPAPGDVVPDFILTNQSGRRVHLSQYKGKVVLLTFIYTRCPLPDFCPRVTSNLHTIENILTSDPALYARTHLLSITLDPEFDTPKVMRDYGRHNAGLPSDAAFAHWEFLTPKPSDLPALAGFFGLSHWKEGGSLVHSLSTAVIASNGQISAWEHGNSWTPEQMVQAIRTASLAGQ